MVGRMLLQKEESKKAMRSAASVKYRIKDRAVFDKAYGSRLQKELP